MKIILWYSTLVASFLFLELTWEVYAQPPEESKDWRGIFEGSTVREGLITTSSGIFTFSLDRFNPIGSGSATLHIQEEHYDCAEPGKYNYDFNVTTLIHTRTDKSVDIRFFYDPIDPVDFDFASCDDVFSDLFRYYDACFPALASPTESAKLELRNGATYTNSHEGATCKVTIFGSNNSRPIANAGPNQEVMPGDTVQLDGSKSYDPDGDPITYSWIQKSGPAVTLSNPRSSNPTFVAPVVPESPAPFTPASFNMKNRWTLVSTNNRPCESMELTFQLTVSDGKSASHPSTVVITVTDAWKVDIWVSAFLPPWTSKGRIPNPVPLDPGANMYAPPGLPEYLYFDYHEFSTDNRNQGHKGGSARQWSYVVVDLCDKDNPLVSKLHGVGESYGFRMEWDKEEERLVEVVDKARSSAKNMKEIVWRNGEKVVVNIEGSTPIPFVRVPFPTDIIVAPDSDYSLQFTLSNSEGHQSREFLNVELSGTTDGFPATEVYVGKFPVYFYTPKKSEGQSPLSPFNSGQSLFSLFAPNDIAIREFRNIPRQDAYDKEFIPPNPTEAEEPIQRVGRTRD